MSALSSVRRLWPECTVRRAPGPGPIRKVEWQPLTSGCGVAMSFCTRAAQRATKRRWQVSCTTAVCARRSASRSVASMFGRTLAMLRLPKHTSPTTGKLVKVKRSRLVGSMWGTHCMSNARAWFQAVVQARVQTKSLSLCLIYCFPRGPCGFAAEALAGLGFGVAMCRELQEAFRSATVEQLRQRRITREAGLGGFLCVSERRMRHFYPAQEEKSHTENC